MPKGITWPDYEGGTVYFAGVPGIYGPGIVVTLESTGKSEAEMRELIVGTPLVIVDMKPKRAAKPVGPAADADTAKDGED